MFLAGRTPATLEAVAEAIRSAGGAAETAEVDALDEQAVDRHADAVAADAGGIDISFNLITHPYTHGTPMAEMAVDDFMAPVQTAARTTFLTARAAARHMIPRRSGVILAFGGPGDRSAPDSRLLPRRHAGRLRRDRDDAPPARGRAGAARHPRRDAGERRRARVAPRGHRRAQEIVEMIEAQTLLGRAATLEDVGNAAVFAASDWARSVTAAIVNVSCGALID